MAETAFQIQYRQEMIKAFEKGQSLLRDAVTTEAVIKGNTATFLVTGSGGASAVTRGANGLIPGIPLDNQQTATTLVEWHAKPEMTGFNIFASQGNQRQALQRVSLDVINRKIDSDIITELNTGTVNTGAAVTASLALVMKSTTILQNAKVPLDGQVYGLITPAFRAYLMQIAAYASSDYVTTRPMEKDDAVWTNMTKMKDWLDVKWIVDPTLPGVGTNAEKCFLFHKSAVGHAVNTGGIMTEVDYNNEHDYSFARCSVYMGTQILQNSGVVVMNHDGSAYVSS